ncbi:hypothetical protein FUAX_35720 [Fulvitalea axinellae]|uniref:Helix-hairpin-helix domain-containing protein n=1 Tax=Fulvitalea axinellae TaxID=1182444 RepID=A0AAU9DJ08_9BACT|nr:hypothetical protein FUAX_35720 [Fulvitalea axinellae]
MRKRKLIGPTDAQTKGMVLFLSITVFYAVLVGDFGSGRSHFQFSESDSLKLDSLAKALDAKFKEDSIRKASEKQPELFAFNPNTADKSTFEKLGIKPAVAGRIVKYREKGGVFRKKEDFAKIYGLSRERFELLKEHIRLPKIASERFPKKRFERKRQERKPKVLEAFDINTADSLQLIAVRGIGPYTARRIMSLRERLGGFVSEDQLSEVYKIMPEGLDNLRKVCFVDTAFSPWKLDINQASFKDVLRHPYFDYEQVKVVFNLKRRAGKLSSFDQLKRHVPDLRPELADYLDFSVSQEPSELQ